MKHYYITAVIVALAVVFISGTSHATKLVQSELACRSQVAELNYPVADILAICRGIVSEDK